ncbi:MAG: penicillin-binding protein 2 [Eubacteriales bacterium]|nr:penicillin-binding protein 2 [Eubacteriales bacterium]
MKRLLKDRYFILGAAMVAFGLVILYNFFELQIVRGQEYYDDSQKSIFRIQPTKAARGKIFDRSGTVIAFNEQDYSLQVMKTGASTKELNEAILKLVKILEKNGDSFNSSLSFYMKDNPIRFQKNLEMIFEWQKNMFGISEGKSYSSPTEFFEYLRKKVFAIDDKYTVDEAYKIMLIRYEILSNNWLYSQYNPVPLSNSISRGSVAEIEERSHELPGIRTNNIPVRRYTGAEIMGQILGYVGPISAELLEEWKDLGYGGRDIVGRTGIELSAEQILRGIDGEVEVEVDTQGRVTKILKEKEAQDGNDILLTIDMNMQKAAMQALEKYINEIKLNKKKSEKNKGDANAGAVVAIDVNTGELLVMASYPSYDPQAYLDIQISEEAAREVARLENDGANRPLWNRTIQEKYTPGSTYKPIVGIAALEEGIIKPNTQVYDRGVEEIGGMKFYCLEYASGLGAHKTLTLERALATSCNMFFHLVGVETTIDKIDKWAKLFGLGERTGVELPYEASGIRSNKEYKMSAKGEEWWIADTAQSSIGQLYNEFTPLQLANYVATIANDGKRFTPAIIKRVLDPDGNVVREHVPTYEQVPVSPGTLEAIREGMRSVAHSVDGTAEEVFRDFPVSVAGKTGTAETGQEATSSSNALFVCYAPAENPQIAIAVVVEHGVWGSYTAPIAKEVLSSFFESRGSYDGKIQETGVFVP